MNQLNNIQDRLRREVATIFFTANDETKKIASEVEILVKDMFNKKNILFNLKNMQIFAEGMDCYQTMSGDGGVKEMKELIKKPEDLLKNKDKLGPFMFRMWLDHEINMEIRKIEEVSNNAIK